MLVGILMAVIFRRLGWQGMHIEFGGETSWTTAIKKTEMEIEGN